MKKELNLFLYVTPDLKSDNIEQIKFVPWKEGTTNLKLYGYKVFDKNGDVVAYFPVEKFKQDSLEQGRFFLKRSNELPKLQLRENEDRKLNPNNFVSEITLDCAFFIEKDELKGSINFNKERTYIFEKGKGMREAGTFFYLKEEDKKFVSDSEKKLLEEKGEEIYFYPVFFSDKKKK